MASINRTARRLVRRLPPYRVYRRANWLLMRVPGANLVRVPAKTATWATKAFIRSRRPREDGAPAVRPTFALGAQVAIDEAVLELMMRPSKFPTTDDYLRVGREVAAAAEQWAREGWSADATGYHRDPPPLTDHDLAIGRGRWLRSRFEHLSWESGFAPRPDEPGATQWSAYPAPHTAHAFVWRHTDRDRPWLVCLHGFGMGFVAADHQAFRLDHLHRRLGLNIAVPVMPLHGLRREPGVPDLLSYDLLGTVHGITQSVWDIRRLLAWIRARTDQPVGAYGISLGGYTGALVATLEDLDLIIAGIPAVDFPGLFRHHAPHRTERAANRHGVLGDAATIAHRVISPVAAPVRVPRDRRFIYAGLGDRMVPPPQARLLWVHWDRPEIAWYPGNHVGFMWSGRVRRFVDDSLVSAGFVDPEQLDSGAQARDPVGGADRPGPAHELVGGR